MGLVNRFEISITSLFLRAVNRLTDNCINLLGFIMYGNVSFSQYRSTNRDKIPK